MAEDVVRNRTDLLRLNERKFQLSPIQWATLAAVRIPKKFEWKDTFFDKSLAHHVPTERGIYAFIVRPCERPGPPHQYLIYIGMTNRCLRTRFREYLGEKKQKKRMKFYDWLNKYESHLYFYYASISDQRVSLSKLERSLNDVFIPPLNENDLSAEIREGKRAFV